MRPSYIISALCTFVLISAQNFSQDTASQLAARFPSCVLPCDKASIASVGCSETDYACHCAHSNQLQSIVVPCLKNSSNCTSADLQTFGTLVKQICLNLNVTGNATSTSTSTSTSNSTSTSTSRPISPSTTIPFQAAASLPQSSLGLISALVAAFVFIL